MVVWLAVVAVSFLLNVGMGGVVFLFSLIALNGFPSMAAAMPTYLAFNCFFWPVMVGVATVTTWLLLAVVRRKRPLWELALINGVVVTMVLGSMALALSAF